MEVYKKLPSTNYGISSYGNVINYKTNKILKPYNDAGYHKILGGDKKCWRI